MAAESEDPVLLKLLDFSENGLFVWNSSDMGEAFQWNFTKTNLEDIAMDANFAWLIFSLLVAMIWFTYVTHYSSRVFGQILTKIINRFVGGGYIRIGSLTWDALAGKIMFRDIVYATEDFSLRIQDGWLVFRWWRSYVPRDISEDLSHSDTRLSLLLNGLELHIYNRSQMYSELEHLFGLESLIIPKDDSPSSNTPKEATSPGKSEESNGLGSKILGRSWRDLIPVIKIEISCGRAVFGNRLVPTTLCLSMEEGHMVYSTKPAVSKLDHFMHVVNCRAENFKVTLAPSLKYTGLNDEPPRIMGEGFVILSSNTIDFYYYMDEPGIVPEVPLMVELANGDVVECHAPIWGLDIRCGKGTDFSYGPWADRKREQLFKFFYPQAYQPMKVTPPQQPGEIRAVQSFDIRFSTLAEATVDILFSKCKETNAVHMTIGAGSYMEITIPWTVKPDGYATKISGQLLHVDASTSLQYRSLLEAETLKFAVLMQYPIAWNASQNWTLSMTGTKATLHFIYEHRYFFQDLINDWSSRSPSDLLHSVPYTWFLSFCLKEFELVTVANQYNWVDCSSHHQENAYAAFSGDYLEMSFNLPFTDFLPPTIELKFRIQGEALDWNIALPEMSTSRPVLIALSTHAKTANRCVEVNESSGERTQNSSDKRWHNFVKRSEGWVQCWTVPILSLNIQYKYHPLSPSGPAPQANVPTPEREELLLTPVRFPAANALKVPKANKGPPFDFDATSLAPDLVNVELELGPSELYLYGSLFRSFLHLKENIFGEDQRMADMDPSAALLDMSGAKNESFNRSSDPIVDPQINVDEGVFDVRLSRPFHVNVSVTMHDIQAHLMKHCNKDDPPCPTISLEKLSFEMNKTFLETRLQVLVSPSVLYSSDLVPRPLGSSHLQQGFVILSALQVRGHAMFSAAGRALDEETLEYSWIIEAILGQLTGRLTLPQLEQIITGLEAFIHLALDDENQLSRPKSQTPCHHGMSQLACSYSAPNLGEVHCLGSVCPTAEEIKYKMTRVSVDLIDITMVETGTALGLQMYPVRMATCNLHSRQTHTGLSILLPTINLRQFLATSRDSTMGHSFTGLNNSSRFKSEPVVKISSSGSTWNRTNASGQSPSVEELYVEERLRQTSTSNRVELDPTFTPQEWLEVGMVEIGPVYIDIGSSMDHSRIDLPIMQNTFLKFHDNRTRRLWFLWSSVAEPELDIGAPSSSNSQQPVYHGKCGCRAGCTFFGRNANGLDFFDHDETGSYVALANPLRRNGDPSFGQSILHDNVWLVDLLESSDADSVAQSRHKSTSELSNSSTVKNMDDVFVHSSKSQSIRDEATLSSIDPRSRISLSSIVSLQELTNHSGDSLSRGRTTSTPALLSMSNENCRRIHPQTSLPMLAGKTEQEHWSERSEGDTNEIYESPTQDRSKASRSESHSELFFSAAEEANTSSDELVSLSSSLPGAINKIHPPLIPTISTDPIPAVVHSTPSSSSSPLSRTTSNISFNSVESSTDDFSLVDLHLQSSRPVVDSPILLASYMTHLAGVECSNWSSPAPKFPTGIHSRTRPKFVLVKKGFSSFRLVDRPVGTPGAYGKTFPFSSPQRAEEKCTNPWDTIEEDKNGMRSDATSVLVKIGRPINAMFCPLTLESTQRFTEALVPTLEQLHPMTFMTRVYSRCIAHVESENPLKKHRVAQLEQKEAREAVYRDVIKYHLRGSLQIPRINLCLLQAGIVEQIISLSALDNPRDLVCVSAAAICIDGLSLYFSKSVRECRTVQLVHRPGETHLSGQQHGTKSKKPGNTTAPALVFVESTQIENEQLMTSGTLGKIHLQLRRLNNDASVNLPDNVTATVIPTGCSRVLFHFQSNDEAPAACTDANGAVPDKMGVTNEEDHHGSVMFECGLQGLELRAVKRVSNSNEKSKVTMEQEGGVATETGPESDPASATSAAATAAAAATTAATTSTATTAAAATAATGTTGQSGITIGSLPSHSSHMSFKLKSDKGGTPTSDVTVDAKVEAKTEHSQQQHREGSEKDVSSCSLQIRTVWLSFAAPPRTTAAKKSDVAILDRNLLSTASPAINAWMNSGDRLTVTVQQLCRASETRNLSILAGLMVEALDLQQIHLPVKSKYNCLSLMSRTLQEDPSCQLNLVLHRYALMLENDWHALEARLSPSVVPPLSTLKQGVVVLSRQWKNAIYTPFMLTYSLHQTSNPQRPTSFPPSSIQSASQNWVFFNLISFISTFIPIYYIVR